jgi:bacterioferritin-associated ferredoxin
MIVCLCKGVSSRQIHEEVRRGHRSVPAIARACGAGTDCGSCVAQIKSQLASLGCGPRSATAARDTTGR